jgi:uncharacterized Zn finger protein
MGNEKKITCPWCQKETVVWESKEKSDYADIVVRRCAECGDVIAAYLDEDRVVLGKVRTFQI